MVEFILTKTARTPSIYAVVREQSAVLLKN